MAPGSTEPATSGAQRSGSAIGGYRGASGAGRVLVVVYAVLALAATGRSAVQLLTHFEVAPLAYSLSAVAALVYIVATVALVRRGRTSHLVAWTAIVFEFVGVLVVGGLSLVHHELFPADTVWSRFGSGYFYIPLVLPIFGIAWLESQRAQARIADARHH